LRCITKRLYIGGADGVIAIGAAFGYPSPYSVLSRGEKQRISLVSLHGGRLLQLTLRYQASQQVSGTRVEAAQGAVADGIDDDFLPY